ncbi:Cadherin-like and PC-esterase domain-containing protein 1 [Sarcoptes scabiei]|uniref:Cadherin-like and PC-esterase domain-containing protein 1 n=1 Tax=Sarcoptes scabiei TaxID=52283 RepID=A0A834RDN5_SARSC|nr:Cadherin-like and PC-esterase domain-containing protein 1 [Sarcoptes scabiei]
MIPSKNLERKLSSRKILDQSIALETRTRKRTKTKAFIDLLLYQFLLPKRFFTFLLIVSGFLFLLSILLVAIYDVPNLNGDLKQIDRFRFEQIIDDVATANEHENNGDDDSFLGGNQWWQWIPATRSNQQQQQQHQNRSSLSSSSSSSFLIDRLFSSIVSSSSSSSSFASPIMRNGTNNKENKVSPEKNESNGSESEAKDYDEDFREQISPQLLRNHLESILTEIQQSHPISKCHKKYGEILWLDRSIFHRRLLSSHHNESINLIDLICVEQNETISNQDDECRIYVINHQHYSTSLTKLIDLIEKNPSLRQRIYLNHFDEIEPFLIRPELICNLFDLIRKYSTLRTNPIVPLCFKLPQNIQQFLDVSDALGYQTNWTLEYYDSNGEASDSFERIQTRTVEPLPMITKADRNRLIQINRMALRYQSNLKNSPRSSRASQTMMSFTPILIKQHFIQKLIDYRQKPIRLRLFILITSINPLRALQYRDGLVFPYTQTPITRAPWIDTMDNFWLSFRQRFNSTRTFEAQNNLQEVLIYFLMLLEISTRLLNLPIKNASFPPKIQTFQWITIDLVSQQSDPFHFYVIEVQSIEKSLKQLIQIDPKIDLIERISNDTENFLKQSFTVPYNRSLKTIEEKLSQSLMEQDNLGLLSFNCHISHRICLSHTDLTFITETIHRFGDERNRLRNKFEPIYPKDLKSIGKLHSNDQENFAKPNIEELFERILADLNYQNPSSSGSDWIQQQHSQHHQRSNNADAKKTESNERKHFYDYFEYQTERLNPIWKLFQNHESSSSSISSSSSSSVTAATPLYLKEQQTSQFYDSSHDLTNINWLLDDGFDRNASSHNFDHKLAGHRRYNKANHRCTNDPKSLNYLESIEIVQPRSVMLKPKFDKSITHYTLNCSIDYDQLLAMIKVEVAHCDTWIKLDNHLYNIQTGLLNFSLGLGDNYIRLVLVDKRTASHLDLKILAIYTIVIHRRTRLEQYPQTWTDLVAKSSNQSDSFELCSLLQDCDFRIYSDVDCGWRSIGQPLSNEKIEQNLWIDDLIQSRPSCESGAEEGRWLVPCRRCGSYQSCVWSQLNWLPNRCHYSIPIARDRLGKCLTNKNIVLIGDSTNRGMMHYILERLNQTLTEADKTHDQKIYELERTSTRISFSYYPKFWLPPDQRPSFGDVMKQTIRSFKSQRNKHRKQKNFIIVGGVQWISQQHLNLIKKILFNEQIEREIKIVVKTLGSGFHQSVIGVHHMALSDQIKLAAQNQQLINEAKRLGFEIIDTFNKTIGLFRDFYPGRCVCHFHKIVKMKRSSTKSSLLDASGQTFHYHVEGEINRLYSEILLSRICP